jgi:hypothetical protein
MPVMVVYDGQGVSVSREMYAPYEADIRSAAVPPEALLHQVAFDEKGLFVVDIWSSRQAFEAWTESRIKPTLKKHGIPYVAPRVLDVDVVAAEDATRHFSQLPASARQPA